MIGYENVVSETQTCLACPTQYEGRLSDGRGFYFRYRHGVASLGFDSKDGSADAVGNSVSTELGLNSDDDDWLDHAAYVDAFNRLAEAADAQSR